MPEFTTEPGSTFWKLPSDPEKRRVFTLLQVFMYINLQDSVKFL